MNSNPTKKEKEITIPREWFESLNDICLAYERSQEPFKSQNLALLLGYLSSAKTILKIHE